MRVTHTRLNKSDSYVLLTKETVYRRAYRILSYIPVYLSVPMRHGLKQEPHGDMDVEISDIDKFQFILNPSQKWLDEIKEAMKEMRSYYCDECPGLVWMHEVFKDRRKYSYIFKQYEY